MIVFASVHTKEDDLHVSPFYRAGVVFNPILMAAVRPHCVASTLSAARPPGTNTTRHFASHIVVFRFISSSSVVGGRQRRHPHSFLCVRHCFTICRANGEGSGSFWFRVYWFEKFDVAGLGKRCLSVSLTITLVAEKLNISSIIKVVIIIISNRHSVNGEQTLGWHIHSQYYYFNNSG